MWMNTSSTLTLEMKTITTSSSRFFNLVLSIYSLFLPQFCWNLLAIENSNTPENSLQLHEPAIKGKKVRKLNTPNSDQKRTLNPIWKSPRDKRCDRPVVLSIDWASLHEYWLSRNASRQSWGPYRQGPIDNQDGTSTDKVKCFSLLAYQHICCILTLHANSVLIPRS